MNLTSSLFSTEILSVFAIIYFILMALALYTAPWKKVSSIENVNILIGWSVLMGLLWIMKAGIHAGMTFHLLGATLFTLMFGWQFASMALSGVLIATTFISGAGDWSVIPLNGVIMVFLPALLSTLVLKLTVKYMPKHFFVYSLMNAFLCAVFMMGIVVMCNVLLMVAFGDYRWEFILSKYLPLVPLFMFAEGFFTGMLITGMILFKPEWVMTFSDEQYLNGK